MFAAKPPLPPNRHRYFLQQRFVHYDEDLAAYQFHHTPPSTGDSTAFAISDARRRRGPSASLPNTIPPTTAENLVHFFQEHLR